MLTTILTALGVIAVLGIVLVVLMKKGIIQDKDGDLIPDRLEELYNETKERLAEMKAEYQDVKKALEELKKQVGDIGQAAQGKKRAGRKPRNKK